MPSTGRACDRACQQYRQVAGVTAEVLIRSVELIAHLAVSRRRGLSKNLEPAFIVKDGAGQKRAYVGDRPSSFVENQIQSHSLILR
jgi:hypothetical protein